MNTATGRDPLPARGGRVRGFTLIELLVTVAIIALLLAILIPNLAAARSNARRTVCAAHLHSLGIAISSYLQNNSDSFFRYYTDVTTPTADFPTTGRLWWFGFEPGGPGTGTYRRLDKAKSLLAPYTADLALLQCPEFPYEAPDFFPKFSPHAASYGVNIVLAPVAGKTPSRNAFADRQQNVFTFADGIHFDTSPGFNEPPYLLYTSPFSPSGFAHFRHANRTQLVYMDGHVESFLQASPTYKMIAGFATANLPQAMYGN